MHESSKPDNFYVYMYLDGDGCPFYIGKGTGDRHKIGRHLRVRGRGFLKSKIINLGTTNIKTHFLHRNLPEGMAHEWERYWIKYIGRRNLGLGTLCNLTDGGEGMSGYSATEETRRKMSTSRRGKKHSPMSDDGKRNVSLAGILGKGKPNKHGIRGVWRCRKAWCSQFRGKYIGRFDTAEGAGAAVSRAREEYLRTLTKN